MPAVVPGTDSYTPEAEREALDALVKSDGWAIYKRNMEESISSAAYERDIRKAMEEYGPDVDMRVIVGQINASYEWMRSRLTWAEDRMRALKDGKAGRKVADGPLAAFARFRLTGRTG